MPSLPEGTVTFLFSDIEGSTRLLQELGEEYRGVLEEHHRLLRSAFVGGTEVGTEGDSFFVVFPSAVPAVTAAVAAQRAVAGVEGPGRNLRVRIGVHTGNGELGAGSYVGIDVHRAARIAGAAHGGQVLVSEATRALVERELPEGVHLRDLGAHHLKDLAAPERLSQLVIEGLPAEFPPIAGPAATNLKAPLTSFVGRERELAELGQLLESRRLVTVVGTGGTGKTRLLVEVGRRLADRWTDGVWLVELAAVTDPELVVQAVARTLGIRDDGSRPVGEAVVDYLRPKRLLLVLDNCEHVIREAAAVALDVLGACPAVTVLASSREALGVSGESVFPLRSLGVPDGIADGHDHDAMSLRAAANSEAVRLFLDRALAVVPDLELSDDDLVAAVEICRRLDGIPLAIELAAARVAALSVTDIAARLGDRFRLLTGGSRTAVPRQQTLEAAIDWSWDLLSDVERRVLCRLSVFVGGCSADAAAAVVLEDADHHPSNGGADRTFEALDLLARLSAKSLVVVHRTATTRYAQLESIRQYARERLAASGESPDIRDRHLRYFLRLATEAAPRLKGPELPATLREIDPDVENYRAAVEWALESDLGAAMRICVSLAIYGRARSLGEGYEMLARVAETAERRELDPAALTALLLAAAANAAWMVGQAAIGDGWARRALEIARTVDDPRAIAESLTARAMTALFLGRTDGVVEWTEESTRLAKTLGDWTGIGFMQAGLAQWEAERGDTRAAAERLDVATDAATRSGSPEVIAFTALSRGRVAGFGGEVEAARDAFRTAIAGYAEIEDHGLVLVARSDLAHALRHNGLLDEAAELYRDTLHEWEHTGNRGAIANQIESVAFLRMDDEPEAAAGLLAAADAMRNAANAPRLSFEQAEVTAAVERLRGRLEPDRFARAWSAGSQLNADTAVATAIRLLPPASVVGAGESPVATR